MKLIRLWNCTNCTIIIGGESAKWEKLPLYNALLINDQLSCIERAPAMSILMTRCSTKIKLSIPRIKKGNMTSLLLKFCLFPYQFTQGAATGNVRELLKKEMRKKLPVWFITDPSNAWNRNNQCKIYFAQRSTMGYFNLAHILPKLFIFYDDLNIYN